MQHNFTVWWSVHIHPKHILPLKLKWKQNTLLTYIPSFAWQKLFVCFINISYTSYLGSVVQCQNDVIIIFSMRAIGCSSVPAMPLLFGNTERHLSMYSLYCHKQSRTGSQLMPSKTLPKQAELWCSLKGEMPHLVPLLNVSCLSVCTPIDSIKLKLPESTFADLSQSLKSKLWPVDLYSES